MKQHPVAFAVAYALIGAQGLAAIAAFVVIMFTPATPVAHKSDIRKALGATDTKALLAQAEAEIANEAASASLTLTEQKLVSVSHPNESTVVLRIRVVTAQYGPQMLTATFHKGIYSLTGLTAN